MEGASNTKRVTKTYDQMILDAQKEVETSVASRLNLIKEISEHIYGVPVDKYKQRRFEKTTAGRFSEESDMKAAVTYVLRGFKWMRMASKTANIWGLCPEVYSPMHFAFPLAHIKEYFMGKSDAMWRNRVAQPTLRYQGSLKDFQEQWMELPDETIFEVIKTIYPDTTFLVNIPELELKDIVVIAADNW